MAAGRNGYEVGTWTRHFQMSRFRGLAVRTPYDAPYHPFRFDRRPHGSRLFSNAPCLGHQFVNAPTHDGGMETNATGECC